jgi:AbrB family looped-hinge helix DNA binding protein
MRVTSKGQVTIPIDIRDKLGIQPNTEVRFVVRKAIAGKAPRPRSAVRLLLPSDP